MGQHVASSADAVTRARILEAARPVVERFTVAKFSIEDVARAAGIARQTVYKYFSGRDDLVMALFVQQLKEMASQFAERAKAEPSIDQLVQLFVEELEAGREFVLFEAALDPVHAPKMAELVFSSSEIFEARNEAWFPVLERYAEAGIVASNVDFAAAVRWMTYQAFWILVHPTVLAPDRETLLVYVRDYILCPLLVQR
ncbi:TetR/AcrR family transcriptional regulator [Haloechinothrix salitolerans]|uniref:TetR/AcrR family transcriptional regulator n=2 Tax=Haloechinothrix salitolerans TaxID=926830 RepID=A0ABW2C2K5_9PSEU